MEGLKAPGALPDLQAITAWKAFLGAHARVTAVLETELQAAHQLPLSFYDVLVQLSEAPGRRLRMSELAQAVLLSRSGLTRLVERMERAGLVSRAPSPGDARGVETVLTDAGLRRIQEAAPTHLRGVAEHVTDLLTPSELEVLTTALDKVARP